MQTTSKATERRVAAAAKEWRSSLINVSGANRMLYYRELRVGTLDLVGAAPGALAELLSQKPVRITRLFPESARAAAAVKSLKAVSGRARVFAEEFGIHVTYIASGFATWPVTATDPDQQTGRQPQAPRAPVLLRQVTVTPRPGSLDGFEVTVTGEAQLNPVMLHLLEAQYGIRVDDAALLERAGEDQEAFELLAKLCSPSLAGFGVEPGLVLGNFFYAEQPLVEDLAEGQASFLASSDLVAALAGDEAASAAVRSVGASVTTDAPDKRHPSDEHLVLDADGSQCYVINAVKAGQNLVVQGPPGTGKSQTIANLIAELVAQDNRVLFVAQKRAAITAVLRRLEEVKLDHLVMDLFAAGSSRKAVVEEVSRAVAQRRATTRPRVDALHDRLVETRDVLVSSQDAIHEPRAPWNLPLLGSRTDDDATWGFYDWALDTADYEGPSRFDMKALNQWDEGTHEHLRAVVADFVASDGVDASLADPGWALHALTTQQVVAEVDAMADRMSSDLLPSAVRVLGDLAAELGLSAPTAPSEAAAVLKMGGDVDRLNSAGVGAALMADTDDDELRMAIYALATRAQRREATQKLGLLARRRLAKATRGSYPAVPSEGLRTLLLECLELRGRWRAASTLPAPPTSQVHLSEAVSHWQAMAPALQRLQPYVHGWTLTADEPFATLGARLRTLTQDRRHRRYPRLHDMRDQLSRHGMEPLLRDLRSTPPADPDEAADRLSQAFARTVIDYVERSDKRLFGIDAAVRDRATTEFTKADVESRSANAQRVRRAAAENLARVLDDEPAQAEILRDQMRRKRGFKPVRQLMTEAPDVLLAAKPVWAASPQSVSELLPAERLFDVVVFDEASQIQPAAALPAIARGAQTVVAGDSLQLPPTTLFTRTVQALFDDGDPEPDDEDGSASGLVVRDMESILDAVETKLGPQRSRHLSWHYRSRDERLIATSNTYVYRPVGRQMTTFPAADGQHALQHVVVPPSPGLGPNNKSPQDEVRTVVDLVLNHAATTPADSLGVIAFGIEHADRIQRELERRLADEPEPVRAWFAPTGDEPFFIKNIERVQGDERQKVILTIGYGRSSDGQLRYNWGPVLQAGGHRRINVAISRARSDIILVTSFAATEVDERASDAQGFHLLRRFITFASTGGADFGDAGAQDVELNPFEYDILRRLEEVGLDVTPQYGVGSYRLDFAVRHPHEPGRFVLAIEADGASYHSGLIARERDRLRQQALEARGWNFVRIWSTDYFRDPESQIDRVILAFEEAVGSGPSNPSAPDPRQDTWEDQPARRTGTRPVASGSLITQYTDAQLDAMVKWVRSDDLPHTRSEVFDMVKSELGFQKNGRNIVARIQAAVDRAM